MPDTISSRTPEGQPNRCPVCGGEIVIEPSLPVGDAPCPQCGVLVWFFDSPEGHRCYEASLVESICNRLAGFVGKRLGVDPSATVDSRAFLTETLGSDSLDVAELVMELEDEFGMNISADEPSQIKTVGQAVEFIAKRTKS
jgi:acyl carrier protein